MQQFFRTLLQIAGLSCFVVLVLCGLRVAQAQSDDDRDAIEHNVKTYVDAFNSHDAKALAAQWSPEGVYISRQTNEQTTGRDALEQEFATTFANHKELKLSVTTTSIEFVSPHVALEQGTAVVARPNAPPEKTSYSVVHVKRDGKWLIDRISEDEVPSSPPSHHEQLKPLDWMIGTWIDQGGGDVIKTTCRWSRNDNFLVRTFSATVNDRIDLAGMQFIGWDAGRKQIRSWVFDSDGGFAEGVWSHQGSRWLIQTTATLPDGKRASSTTVIEPIDKDRFSWQQVNRVVDGEILPDIDRVVIVRQ